MALLNLQGDRFKPLTAEQLTPEQKAMVDDLLSGARTSLEGPFNMLLRSPEMGNLAQKLGEYLRFRNVVPKRLNEMAILMTARWWSSQYEWHFAQDDGVERGFECRCDRCYPSGPPAGSDAAGRGRHL